MMSNAASRMKKQIKRTIRAAMQHAEIGANASGEQAGSVNVARRANIKIATNVGEPNATADASATQVAPIRQTSGNSAGGTNREASRNR
ncbi:MAG: hypothetical protein ACR2M3_07685 [Thermomicrobiales bacterium]